MECASAIALANLVVLEPGWQLTATDHTNRFEGCVKIRIDYPARNTNHDQAATGFPERICTYAEFPLIVGDCEDDKALYRKIIACILAIKEHEIREYFRIEPTYWAPFHPHRIDGMKRWKQADESVDLAGDLMFGIT